MPHCPEHPQASQVLIHTGGPLHSGQSWEQGGGNVAFHFPSPYQAGLPSPLSLSGEGAACFLHPRTHALSGVCPSSLVAGRAEGGGCGCVRLKALPLLLALHTPVMGHRAFGAVKPDWSPAGCAAAQHASLTHIQSIPFLATHAPTAQAMLHAATPSQPSIAWPVSQEWQPLCCAYICL